MNRGKVDAIVQVGTNLAMAEVAAMAEFWLDKPVLAINTATYWYALRDYGIKDRSPAGARSSPSTSHGASYFLPRERGLPSLRYAGGT